MKKTLENNVPIQSSFRDPSGFLFRHDGKIFRQINHVYKDNYDQLMDSGLYKGLIEEKLLIPHEEVSPDYAPKEGAYKVIRPEQLGYISYPYEWCFSQLQDAALATLKVQNTALQFDMSLKDASAYNIQFHKGKPIFIDTLSFEKAVLDKPWVAYRQFCQHFLAPLSLMSYTDVRLNQLLKIYIDGMPLDLASSLLPMKTSFKFSLLSHIHLHAKSQKNYSNKEIKKKNRKMSRLGFLGLMNSLEKAVKHLKWKPEGTEWADYYEDTNYSSESFKNKEKLVINFLKEIKPGTAWDLGANTGVFSRTASQQGFETISFDVDYSAVEKNYLENKKRNETKILPLLFDATNPSPGIGWQNMERESFTYRGPADVVLALALIHHLAISNNVPFSKIGSFFHGICQTLIIEFVPKNDSQVQRLLASREDIFPNYTLEDFEKEFMKYFEIKEKQEIQNSDRVLFLMQKR